MADQKYRAVLERGEVYAHLASKTTFHKGKAEIIDQELKDHLDAEAVDVLSDKGETFKRAKFKFTKVSDTAESTTKEPATKAKPASARKRTASKADAK